ncbi:stress response translation initiation inhibitor YciH [Candidatus Woesearchaeota archaeon]|nr:stress response translation initiation inhibitor YciH [Candidatus Woesearchaeota archaeon]|tara:strand:+ start:6804 stop:7112 length:309 start_codon:yes stop_codon:yes gene_type:complete
MGEVCDTCGLPKEICACESIAKENQQIIVKTEKRKFGKVNTLIGGIDGKEIGMKELTKKLKSQLACGGTIKEGIIELQGDHRQKAKEILIQSGFAQETIIIR